MSETMPAEKVPKRRWLRWVVATSIVIVLGAILPTLGAFFVLFVSLCLWRNWFRLRESITTDLPFLTSVRPGVLAILVFFGFGMLMAGLGGERWRSATVSTTTQQASAVPSPAAPTAALALTSAPTSAPTPVPTATPIPPSPTPRPSPTPQTVSTPLSAATATVPTPSDSSSRDQVVTDYLKRNFGMPGYETSWFTLIREVQTQGDTVTVRTDIYPDAEGKQFARAICSAVSGLIYAKGEENLGLRQIVVRAKDGRVLIQRADVADKCS